MKLVDLNLLIYAVNSDSEAHKSAKDWLEACLSGDEAVALPWIVVLGFLRVVTNRRVLTRPLTLKQAIGIIDRWVGLEQVVMLAPGDDHWRILKRLLEEAGTAGNLTTDTHLAALPIEHGCELYSTDQDFARFPKLRWVNPLI